VRAGLAVSCGFSPPLLPRPELARQYETEADHDRCEVSLRDTCVLPGPEGVLLGPDDQACERAGNSCANICGERCGGCRGRCVASCESCKRDCTDEACRQRCGDQCSDCHVACTTTLDRCVTERCGRWSNEACQEEASQRALEEGCEARCAAARPCTEACAAISDPSRSSACRAACLSRLDPTRAACVASCDRRYPGRVKPSTCEIECPGDRACEQRNTCLAACAPVCFMSCRQ
jgi:hypothetical protein